MKYFAILSLMTLICCVIARAPSLLSESEVPILHLKLKLNAGYVLLFGPLVITAVLGVLVYFTWRDRADRQRRMLAGDFAVRLVPALGVAFLALQFFLLLAPPQECNTFARWRYLFDGTVRAFQPEYCMGLPKETQAAMPWLLNPPIVQAWLQLFLPLVALLLAILSLQRAYRPR